MANYVLSELSRYFRDMKNDATSHDKIMVLVSVGILIGAGTVVFKGVGASVPGGLVFTISLGTGLVLWLVAFSLGVLLRARAWPQVFPPYQLIGRATVPVLILAFALGCLLGVILYGVSLSRAATAAVLGHLATVAVMHVLFRLHTPVTTAAIKVAHNPNVATVDSHRYMWLFPAIGVVVVLLVCRASGLQDFGVVRHVAATAAIVTAIGLAGFGSGYIP